MNRLITLWIGLGLVLSMMAQSYTFESVTTDWSAQQGTLTQSGDHYKEGSHSLLWQTKGKSVLYVKNFAQYSTTSSNGCYMQIYLPEATEDTLVVEFLNGTSVKRTAKMVCNYEGWREFNRGYTEYATTSGSTITALRMTLYPTDMSERRIYFDDVKLNTTPTAGRVPGTQWVVDVQYMKGGGSTQMNPLLLYANMRDIATTAPTAEELSGLATIRSRVLPVLTANMPQAITAKNWVNSNISLSRDANGRVLGSTIINTSASALTESALEEIGSRLQTLAGGKLNGSNAAVNQAFDDYLDVLLDQGLAEGANIAFASNSYSAPRTVIPLFVNILSACNDHQREQVARLISWMSFYYMAYYPADTYLAGNVSDVLYLFVTHMQAAAAGRAKDADAVRELKAMKRFLDRNAEYVPGGGDMLKPDGTGFHHNTHYNNYMYAYQTYTTAIYNFRNTCFEVSRGTYERFGKAVMSVYTMATGSSADTRYFANSLCGRNPFDAGTKLAYTKSNLKQLIESGDSYPDLQKYYQGAYNYFYQTKTYDVPEVSMDGCHQFNYSPCAIVRRGNWVATMRAPTAKFWGAEIYSKENRFGRYQSHGSLDIMYAGSSLAASGYPTNKTGGGWDWNVIPGTTTVHYTSWSEMMPKENQTQRFDQYSNGTNFSGAVADGAYGIFATNLSQTDKWGGTTAYTATNLKAHKSVFILDSILVALGTDISSSGSYADSRVTATNLFQNIISSSVGKLVVNGTEVSSAYSETLPRSNYNWIVNPAGTGYYLPATNQQVQVVYGAQKTPVETGADYSNPTTSLTAAKAYINHGSKVNGGRYEFAVVPATTSARMKDMAVAMNKGEVYRVLEQSSSVHAVAGGAVTAYAFYSAASGMSYGIVRSTTHQHLLIDRYVAETNCHVMTACNPNLEPQSDVLYGWVASSTQTTLTVEGEWMVAGHVQGVSSKTPENGKTEIEIEFEEGEKRVFELVSYDPTRMESVQGDKVTSAVSKRIVDAQMVIERDGVCYTVLGERQ